MKNKVIKNMFLTASILGTAGISGLIGSSNAYAMTYCIQDGDVETLSLEQVLYHNREGTNIALGKWVADKTESAGGHCSSWKTHIPYEDEKWYKDYQDSLGIFSGNKYSNAEKRALKNQFLYKRAQLIEQLKDHEGNPLFPKSEKPGDIQLYADLKQSYQTQYDKDGNILLTIESKSKSVATSGAALQKQATAYSNTIKKESDKMKEIKRKIDDTDSKLADLKGKHQFIDQAEDSKEVVGQDLKQPPKGQSDPYEVDPRAQQDFQDLKGIKAGLSEQLKQQQAIEDSEMYLKQYQDEYGWEGTQTKKARAQVDIAIKKSFVIPKNGTTGQYGDTKGYGLATSSPTNPTVQTGGTTSEESDVIGQTGTTNQPIQPDPVQPAPGQPGQPMQPPAKPEIPVQNIDISISGSGIITRVGSLYPCDQIKKDIKNYAEHVKMCNALNEIQKNDQLANLLLSDIKTIKTENKLNCLETEVLANRISGKITTSFLGRYVNRQIAKLAMALCDNKKDQFCAEIGKDMVSKLKALDNLLQSNFQEQCELTNDCK